VKLKVKIEKEKATEDQFQKDTEQAIQLSEEEQAAKTENEKMIHQRGSCNT